jgi:polyhydroxyalkanoate synthase
MISWVNPSSEHQKTRFADYMSKGPLASLKIIKQITKQEKANVLGYCIGGTLLGCTLAYLAKKNDTRILSATFLTTLFDFSEPGDLGVFIDNNQLPLLEKQMKTKGYMDGNMMATVFNALRAKDLIWSAFINNYLKGEKPAPFDLLFWNADATHIPMHVHSFYLRNMYLKNHLVQKDQMTLRGVSLDLSKITVPSYFLAAQDDHIVPWQSAYKSSHFYGGKVKFVLSTSGHVAGVINPPYKNKYGYWTYHRHPNHPDKYLSSATFTQGSWWNDWIIWLKKYSGQLQSVGSLPRNKLAVIENAPGTYVKVRINDWELT